MSLQFEPYRPRSVRFLRLASVGGWQIKLYGIGVADAEVPESLIASALRAARTVLPSPARADGRPGIGFITVHAAPSRSYVLISWWAERNEIHQRILSAPPGAHDALGPHPSHAIGCVWELGVTDFERRAWIADVLSRPERPSFAAYLGREYHEVF